MGSLPEILGAKAQQSLPVHILVYRADRVGFFFHFHRWISQRLCETLPPTRLHLADPPKEDSWRRRYAPHILHTRSWQRSATNVKTSHENWFEFILCSNCWLLIEVTARQKTFVLFRRQRVGHHACAAEADRTGNQSSPVSLVRREPGDLPAVGDRRTKSGGVPHPRGLTHRDPQGEFDRFVPVDLLTEILKVNSVVLSPNPQCID